MRQNVLLLLFTALTSVVVWNTLKFSDSSFFIGDETTADEIVASELMGEEENETFEESLEVFHERLMEFQPEKEGYCSIQYVFSLATVSLEPEEFPPC